MDGENVQATELSLYLSVGHTNICISIRVALEPHLWNVGTQNSLEPPVISI